MGRFSLNGSRAFYSFQHEPLPSSLPTTTVHHRSPPSSPSYSCLILRSRLLSIIQLLVVACSSTLFIQRLVWDTPIDHLQLCFTFLFTVPSIAIVWMVMRCEYSNGSVVSSRSRDCSMVLSLLSVAFFLTSLLLFIHQELSADRNKERPYPIQLTKDLLFYGLTSLLYLICSSTFSSLHSHYKNLVFSTLRTRSTLPQRIIGHR